MTSTDKRCSITGCKGEINPNYKGKNLFCEQHKKGLVNVGFPKRPFITDRAIAPEHSVKPKNVKKGHRGGHSNDNLTKEQKHATMDAQAKLNMKS